MSSAIELRGHQAVVEKRKHQFARLAVDARVLLGDDQQPVGRARVAGQRRAIDQHVEVAGHHIKLALGGLQTLSAVQFARQAAGMEISSSPLLLAGGRQQQRQQRRRRRAGAWSMSYCGSKLVVASWRCGEYKFTASAKASPESAAICVSAMSVNPASAGAVFDIVRWIELRDRADRRFRRDNVGPGALTDRREFGEWFL